VKPKPSTHARSRQPAIQVAWRGALYAPQKAVRTTCSTSRTTKLDEPKWCTPRISEPPRTSASM
jgi:hypothetical protein